ncbi:MAG: Sir2 family NAD-dependent protein deacetylase [Halioglobus sp.]
MRDARPNAAHRALATLERAGHVERLVTQNVDRLHQRAGSRAVIDLHGRLDTVRCLACDHCVHRDSVQAQLAAQNCWVEESGGSARPDGDHDISDDKLADVALPLCEACGGDLKPDVVFFGGNIPARRLEACTTALERAHGLLAVGSSLQVFSGFRLCRSMHRAGKPVLIVNPGVTRADDLASAHLRSPAAALLDGAAAALRLTRPACAGDNPN